MRSAGSLRASILIACALGAGIGSGHGGQPAETASASPSPTMAPAPAGEPESPNEADPKAERSWWLSVVVEHAPHVALVLGTAALDSGVERERGARSSPLLFGSPPRLDEWVRGRFRRGPEDTEPHGFVESHVTPVTRGIALAAILISNGPRWKDDVHDLIGLWEAQRFNVAMTGIVKNLAGRERPRLEFAEEEGATPGEIGRLDRSPSQHQSFYSYHASSAFTTLAYADLVLSRRLREHPAARRWSRAGLYLLGAYVAWARVLQDAHHFTDVVAGSFAGIYTGRSFYAFNHEEGIDRWLSWDPRPGSRISLAPPCPIRGGVVVTGRVSF